MKKTLLFTIVIGMYVLFCGCPYQNTDTGNSDHGGPTLLGTPVNVDLAINPGNGFNCWKGTLNNNTQVSFTIANISTPRSPNTYAFTLIYGSGASSVNLVTDSCFFFTGLTNQPANTYLMEVIQQSSPPPTSSINYSYALVTLNSGKIGNIYPFPAGINNISYPGNPQTPSGYISAYMKFLTTSPPSNQLPQNTDALTGYDGDSEIKGVTSSTFAPGGGSGGGTYLWATNTIIFLIIEAILLLIFGWIFGNFYSKKKMKK